MKIIEDIGPIPCEGPCPPEDSSIENIDLFLRKYDIENKTHYFILNKISKKIYENTEKLNEALEEGNKSRAFEIIGRIQALIEEWNSISSLDEEIEYGLKK